MSELSTIKTDPHFEIVLTTQNVRSIRCTKTEEIMHNPVGPVAEAQRLYIEQSGYQECLTKETDEPLVLWDVGLGAAFNTARALTVAQGLAKTRPLHIVSFENDLSLLKFAFDHHHAFEDLTQQRAAIEAILTNHRYKRDGLDWIVHVGDFPTLIRGKTFPRPDIVFFDPYSPKMNPEMWTFEIFRSIFEVTHSQTRLVTYSRSTGIRAALLAAGFYVGTGIALSDDIVPTIATTDLSTLEMPLGEKWLARWLVSTAPWPILLNPEHKGFIRDRILNHSQFQLTKQLAKLI